MEVKPSREELQAAHCWEEGDRLPGRQAMTDFRRRLRFQQARWRETQGHPVGSQPIVARGESRSVGSRLPFGYARETGANFITPRALTAARTRTSLVEAHQSFGHQRFWADLLSAPALAINLYGDLAADLQQANRAVQMWWPDIPGTVTEIRFAHSPGRLDPSYLTSLRAFDAAFLLELNDGTRGIIGVDTKYHDWLKPETPRPDNLTRYLDVASRSGVFAPGATDRVKGRSELAEIWLEHLLVLSMLQHASGTWTWGRYVVVHPAGNLDVVAGCDRYRDLLVDQSTFATMTLEDLVDSHALPKTTETAVRARYVLP